MVSLSSATWTPSAPGDLSLSLRADPLTPIHSLGSEQALCAEKTLLPKEGGASVRGCLERALTRSLRGSRGHKCSMTLGYLSSGRAQGQLPTPQADPGAGKSVQGLPWTCTGSRGAGAGWGGDQVSPGPLLTSPGQAPGSGKAGKVLPRPHSAASLPPEPRPEPWALPPSEAVTRLIHQTNDG